MQLSFPFASSTQIWYPIRFMKHESSKNFVPTAWINQFTMEIRETNNNGNPRNK